MYIRIKNKFTEHDITKLLLNRKFNCKKREDIFIGKTM